MTTNPEVEISTVTNSESQSITDSDTENGVAITIDSASDASAAQQVPSPSAMDDDTMLKAMEAVLFVVESPVTSAQLAVALNRPTTDIEELLLELQRRLVHRDSGLELRAVAGGYRLYTRAEFSEVVSTFLLEGQRSKLSNAALETLAVVAYRQPVTRARISAIRGVNVDAVVRTLVLRGLIVEAGTDAETGGGLYKTTELFLERLGLNDLAELPSLAPLLPELDSLETDELSS